MNNFGVPASLALKGGGPIVRLVEGLCGTNFILVLAKPKHHNFSLLIFHYSLLNFNRVKI